MPEYNEEYYLKKYFSTLDRSEVINILEMNPNFHTLVDNLTESEIKQIFDYNFENIYALKNVINVSIANHMIESHIINKNYFAFNLVVEFLTSCGFINENERNDFYYKYMNCHFGKLDNILEKPRQTNLVLFQILKKVDAPRHKILHAWLITPMCKLHHLDLDDLNYLDETSFHSLLSENELETESPNWCKYHYIEKDFVLRMKETKPLEFKELISNPDYFGYICEIFNNPWEFYNINANFILTHIDNKRILELNSDQINFKSSTKKEIKTASKIVYKKYGFNKCKQMFNLTIALKNYFRLIGN